MTRGEVAFYVHHHGRGHLARTTLLGCELAAGGAAVTLLGELPHAPSLPGVACERIGPDADDPPASGDPSVHGLLHWAPRGADGQFAERMRRLAAWLVAHRPAVLVTDTSVEVTLLARLLGIPTVVVTQPGERTDAAHRLGFACADAIIAPWPERFYRPDWLAAVRDRVVFTGAPTGNALADATAAIPGTVLEVTGAGGSAQLFDQAVAPDAGSAELADPWRTGRACPTTVPPRTGHQERPWRRKAIGPAEWCDDVPAAIASSQVVVCHAGQNLIAEVAAADRPAVVIPQHRPFGEQAATAAVLHHHGLARALLHEPTDWEPIYEQAIAWPRDWTAWAPADAVDRALEVIGRWL
ncbi:glycosyltransferase [Flexivirga meconopsidis]|uniref:glycosyltransferase n=1 Tax=Flexivirga meconopsidis TaxID=2977121 RepID=UPI00223FFB52|nr:glycosyltransferase [Flexivirga meconopsidis]